MKAEFNKDGFIHLGKGQKIDNKGNVMSNKDIDRKEIAAECLDALGSAYRSNWSNIDGRQTRSEMNDISALLRKKQTFTVEEYLDRWGIVKTDYGFQWVEDV